MARGKATKRVEMTVNQTVSLNKSGLTVVVRDEETGRLYGTLVLSVGGLCWYRPKRRGRLHTWDDLARDAADRGL